MKPLHIANSILNKMWTFNKEVRPMKLQKLIYYTVGFYYKKTKDIILEDDMFFHKWQYGPVIPKVYSDFKKYEYKPIIEYGEDEDKKSYIVSTKNVEFDTILNDVVLYYGDKTDYLLSDMTHRHYSWSLAKMNEKIDHKHFKDTFTSIKYGG